MTEKCVSPKLFKERQVTKPVQKRAVKEVMADCPLFTDLDSEDQIDTRCRGDPETTKGTDIIVPPGFGDLNCSATLVDGPNFENFKKCVYRTSSDSSKNQVSMNNIAQYQLGTI